MDLLEAAGVALLALGILFIGLGVMPLLIVKMWERFG